MTYVCVATTTFGCALVLSLLVESPLTRLGRYLEDAIKHHSSRLKANNSSTTANNSSGNGSSSYVPLKHDSNSNRVSLSKQAFESRAEAGFEAAQQSPGFLSHTISGESQKLWEQGERSYDAMAERRASEVIGS
jgi:activator of HSP90 ATPase